jgi:ABC-type branched-subunit amino acid transport system ATPase component/ABC-type branched-subunit amino acid transport system permease subunit
MGMVGTGLFVLMAVQYDIPFWLAAVVGLVVGTLYGAVVELTVVRRLFDAPRVILLVATMGVAQLSLAILTAYPDIDVPGAEFPQAVGAEHRPFDIRVTGAQLTTILVVPAIALLLAWFLGRTTLGRTVTASATNPELSRLSGINPKIVSTFVWATAGFLSTISLALVAGQSGSVYDLETLGPSTLVRALAAAVIARMTSFTQAVAAGVAIGVGQSLIQFSWIDQPGLVDMILFLVVLVAVALQGRSGGDDVRAFAFAPRSRPIPAVLRDRWWARQIDRAGLALLGLCAVVLPLLVTQTSRHLLYATILGFAVAALSVTVLTGWAGQLSLGQMAFAGIGALLAAAFERGIAMNAGIGSVRIINARLDPLPFWLSLVLAVLVTAGLAAVIGAGALRVSGLLLAVSTFAFGVAASQYIYRRPLLTGGVAGQVRTPRSGLFGIDLTEQRSHYFFCLVCLALAAAVVGRLRRTGVGRTTIAVRDNAPGAAACTVPPARTKLRAFALAGGLAALGGILLSGAIGSVPSDRFFTVDASLSVVSMVVIGGLGSVGGAILGALWVVGLPAFFPDNELVPLLTSSIGLLVLLMYFPGGLVRAVHAGRDAALARIAGRVGRPEETSSRPAVVDLTTTTRNEPTGVDVVPLTAQGVTVRFGGLVAVDGVDITVGRDEIVGLIGTNGAGKSTLMSAIGGYLPCGGRVEIEGRDVTHLSAARRARLGLGRTFQAATLFPELTVLETVEVALEARHRTGLPSAALALPRSTRAERAMRREADDIVGFLGLGRYGDHPTGQLSTGTRRIVELAILLALDARVLCLDEPTAGVAQRETEAFGPLLLEIRRHLGASMLVIEHDMPLIMGISDRIYCMEAGRVIAEGDPAAVRHDPAVVASYLGTDERAITRSGAAASSTST